MAAFGGRPLDARRYWTLKRRGARWAELLARSEVAAAREGAFLERFAGRPLGLAVAAWAVGLTFLAAMGAIGCVMTAWVGMLTVLRG